MSAIFEGTHLSNVIGLSAGLVIPKPIRDGMTLIVEIKLD